VTKKVDPTLGKFAGQLVFYVVMIGALLGVLGKMGVSVASFAAVIAAAGFAIGLAFQGTLSNFAAGVMLLVFRPFKVGDVVNAAGITAKVGEIDLFTTAFDTPDNRHIIVPNSSIFGSTIENVTFHPERRVDVAVGCDYAADIDKTREVLTAAVESVPGRIDGEGRGFQIYLTGLGDSSVDWAVRVWFPTPDYWAKKEELTRAVKMHLDEAGVGIPFPQMDVHIDGKLGD
jgi:small conductance mechanosensitive channel